MEWFLFLPHSIRKNIGSLGSSNHDRLPFGLFLAEPELLLYDEVREPRMYRAVLQAIGNGAHTLDEIANATFIGKSHLSSYLARLQELGLIERRLPVTIHPSKRLKSRMGRYHLTDSFFRFYFRFVAPQLDELGYHPDHVLAVIKEHLAALLAALPLSSCRVRGLRA